jgi:pimeloyl-ACP methyl ester carboxylesterase
MKKIIRPLLYILASFLLVMIVLFSVYAQRDIPVEKLKLKYAQSPSKFLPMMGMQVHYRDEGNPNDPSPLILIHGTSSSLNTWDSVVKIITSNPKNKKRIIRFDLPAFGLTGPNPENDYAGPYYINFVDSFLNVLQINKCTISGNSLGGGIAWQYAVAHPEKVNKLILLDPTGYPQKNEKGSLGFKIASLPIINNLMLFITPKSLIKKSLEAVFYDKSFVTEATVTRYHELLLSAGNRRATLSLFKSRRSLNPNEIKSIQQPTLIIWGEQDQLISVDNAYLFKQDIKNSQLFILPNVGHIPMEESYVKVANAIQSFINQ